MPKTFLWLLVVAMAAVSLFQGPVSGIVICVEPGPGGHISFKASGCCETDAGRAGAVLPDVADPGSTAGCDDCFDLATAAGEDRSRADAPRPIPAAAPATEVPGVRLVDAGRPVRSVVAVPAPRSAPDAPRALRI